jgi:membrane-associated phospholipid phosphatase
MPHWTVLVVFGLVCANARAAAPSDDWYAPELLARADTREAEEAKPAQYPPVESPISGAYLKLLWADTVEVATGPTRWDRDEWRNFALISGAIVITAAALDKPIKDAAQRNRSSSSDRFFRDIEKFGTKSYGLPLLAGFYGYGALEGDNEAKAVALDGFSASILSSLATSAIKGVVGRRRPNTGMGPHSFSPFQGDYSFPSGHATGAFAFASVIATHYDDTPWVEATSYGVAGLVGIARIELNAHWASDVVAGSLIGGIIGHHLVHFNEKWREEHSAFTPTLKTDGQQLLLSWEF